MPWSAGATYTPAATATSGLAVAITVDASASAVCSITAGVVSFQTAGTCILDGNQAGNANYNAATQVQQSFAVGKGAQTVTFTSTAPAGATVGGATYTPAATASSGLAVAITVDASASSVCTITAGVVSFQATGTCILDGNQAGNANYNAATQVQQSFAVGKGAQTVSFTSTAPAGAVVGGATYTPAATATSGLAVTITVDASASAVCSITAGVGQLPDGGHLHPRRQPGRQRQLQRRHPGPAVLRRGQGRPDRLVHLDGPGRRRVGGATYTPTATATSGLAVTITVDASASSVCSITAGVVSFTDGGHLRPRRQPGRQRQLQRRTQVQQSFAVGKAAQTVTTDVDGTRPAPSVGGPTYTPTATASSGLAVAITIDACSSSVCKITAGAVSYQATGTCLIDFNQAGNANYNAAPQVQQPIAVGLIPQAITFTRRRPPPRSAERPTRWRRPVGPRVTP